jgi:flagellar motor switch protein FliG
VFQNTNSSLRKAAVLVRSMDADTAATLLTQLSPAEAAALRGAVRALGAVDAEEEADVLAEFRRNGKMAGSRTMPGVELKISAYEPPKKDFAAPATPQPAATGKRFAFLEDARVESLAAYLAREHAQTIAVVLSHLNPARAAQALAALPAKIQADTVERLSTLGDADPETVIVLERELAAWVARRSENRQEIARRRQSMMAIFSAADATARHSIMANLKCHKAALAEQIAPTFDRNDQQASALRKTAQRALAVHARWQTPDSLQSTSEQSTVACEIRSLRSVAECLPDAAARVPPPAPTIDFENLVHLDDRMLNDVLRQVDANALALALASSSDALVDRVCQHMPRRVAKAFRRELRRLGPTRLSDIETAQRAVAQVAARQLAGQYSQSKLSV